MRSVFGLVLIAGLALAGFAVYMVQGRMAVYQSALAEERAGRNEVATVPVFVATRTLAYGERLTAEDVRAVDWPMNAVPEGAFVDANVLFPEDQRDPRYVRRAMEKDEPLMAIKITEPGEEVGVISRLERGMRAFAISVDVASGVSGFLRPGDHVDVYWTGDVDDSRGEVTKLIQTRIKLIAVDQSASKDETETRIARTVTVAVNPQQVAALAQAQSTGQLTLSLVGFDDETIAEAIEIDQRMLLGLPEEAPQQVRQDQPMPEERVCTIRTRRGAEVANIVIPCTN
ncbi:Flp pilus assembly protein CpaB [Pseudooceanicola aestuarii]|uniref:Flp pilus assembly protein CpaB n=1 Tax=Pseudooceanicola aestuarii TaxID=2697319 RepID=UPI0013D54AAD|nr:Flp pilus assembly protein CpaB [Pseudooceanicola aestuarii]